MVNSEKTRIYISCSNYLMRYKSPRRRNSWI